MSVERPDIDTIFRDVQARVESDPGAFEADVASMFNLNLTLPPALARQRAGDEHLDYLFQDFTSAAHGGDLELARALLEQAKNYAETQQIGWETLPAGWQVIQDQFLSTSSSDE